MCVSCRECNKMPFHCRMSKCDAVDSKVHGDVTTVGDNEML